MKHLPYKKSVTVFGCIIMLLTTWTLFAQLKPQENKAKNLKVLPANISQEELDKQMKFYCSSLSVKCNYCHTASIMRQGGLDFASDSAAGHKDDARRMITLTREINEKYFGASSKDPILSQAINCYTCHRGQEFPTVEIDSLLKKK